MGMRRTSCRVRREVGRGAATVDNRGWKRTAGLEKLAKYLVVALVSLALALVFPVCALAEDLGEGDNPESHNYVDERQIPDGSFLYDTSIEALATADVFYDNTTVVVTGEVVGDRRSAGVGSDSSWITLYSLKKNGVEQYNPSSVEVCVSDSLADTIDMYGRYNVRGTYIQVSGTYHLACADHNGLSDIHADSLSLVRKGAQLGNPFDVTMFFPGVLAVLAGLLVILVHKRIVDKAR
mgnify:CR=1 FL=1